MTKEMDKDGLKYLAMLVDEGERFKWEKTDARNWELYEHFWKGEHWIDASPENPRPVTNFCFSTIRTSTALLTDTQPEPVARPWDREDLVGSDVMSRIFKKIWNDQGMAEGLPGVIQDAHIFGTAFIKTFFKDGEIKSAIILPEYLGFSQDTTNVRPWNNDCSYMYQKSKVSLNQIRRLFGDKAKNVKPDASITDSLIMSRINPASRTMTNKFTDTEGQKTTEKVANASPWYAEIEGQGMAWVIEMYLFDTDKKDYRVTTFSGGEILAEKWCKEITGKAGLLPFVPFYNYKESGQFLGRSEMQLLVPLNRTYNLLDAMLLENIKDVGNTIWVTSTNSGVIADKLTNGNGMVIFTIPGTDFRRDPAPQQSPEAYRMLAESKFKIDTMSGVQDVAKGIKPTGITAGVAISELQDAAQVPIRFKGRILQVSLNHLAHNWLELVKEFYTDESVADVLKGMSDEHQAFKLSHIKTKGYDIFFDVESSLGQTRDARLNKAIQLRQLGVYDERAVLEEIQSPNREEVLKRLANKQMTDAVMPLVTQMGSKALDFPEEILAQMETMKKTGAVNKDNVSAPVMESVLENAPT